MKVLLNDTSDITLDLDDQPAASQPVSAHASRPAIDPFLAPTALEFVPASLLAQPCFLPPKGAASPKRRRSSVATRAAGEEDAAAGIVPVDGDELLLGQPEAHFEEEQEWPPPPDEQLPFGTHEEPENMELPAPSSARRSSRGAAEAGPIPPSFAATAALPEVDASAIADPASNGGAPGSQVCFLILPAGALEGALPHSRGGLYACFGIGHRLAASAQPPHAILLIA
jgi:hypothetical protein